MSPHTGKIARLPRLLRDELNHRLQNGDPGPAILTWLNSLPEVQSLLTESFDGKPINAQNLSNWRRHGFTEWQNRENFLEGLRHVARDAADIASALGSGTVTMAEHAARLLALHFTRILCPSEAIRGQPSAGPVPSNSDIKILCELSRAINSLRRGDLAAARLELQRQRQRQHQHPHQSQLPPPSSPAEKGKEHQTNTITRAFPAPAPQTNGHASPVPDRTPAPGTIPLPPLPSLLPVAWPPRIKLNQANSSLPFRSPHLTSSAPPPALYPFAGTSIPPATSP